MGTRKVHPDSRRTYETTKIKVTPNQEIAAWHKRFYYGKLNTNSQGPFYDEDIYEYTQQTLRTGISKRRKHKYNKATCDVPADNMSKLSVTQDEMFGSIRHAEDVYTIDKLVPSQHRSFHLYTYQ